MAASSRPTPFGAFLTTIREARDLTKAAASTAAGLDASTVSRFESGERTPDRETVLRMAQGLGLAPSERETLLAVAGYRSEAWDDPLLQRLVNVLINPKTPDEVAESVRSAVTMAVEYAERRGYD